MNPLLKSFAHAFARSAAGVVAVYVVPIAIRHARRVPGQVRAARCGYHELQIRRAAAAIRRAQARGCHHEAALDQITGGQRP